MREEMLREALAMHCSWRRRWLRISHLTAGDRLKLTPEELEFLTQFFQSEAYEGIVSRVAHYHQQFEGEVFSAFRSWWLEKKLNEELVEGQENWRIRL